MTKFLTFLAMLAVAYIPAPRSYSVESIALDLPAYTISDVNYSYSMDDLDCLTDNVYYEAGNQSDAGKIAVALVTLTRVHSDYFKPKTVCGIVTESRWRNGRKVCQFSWVCQSVKPASNHLDLKAYSRSRQLAQIVLERIAHSFDYSTAPTSYHAVYVSPSWAKSAKMIKIATIGKHIFYKEIR